MDQLKVYLAILKKHHFWVLSVVVLIAGAVGWIMASSALSNTYKTERSKIDSEFTELQKVSSTPDHPNEKWKAGVDGLTKQMAGSVENAWRLSYDEQQKKVLVWPKELGASFAKTISSLGANEEIPAGLRDKYLNYVQREFPKLLQIVDARPYFLGEGPLDENGDAIGRAAPRVQVRPRPAQAGKGPRRGEPVKPLIPDVLEAPDHDYKVIWDTKNQKDIHQELTFPDRPASPVVRSTQENLWVYRALLDLIANVNSKASGHHNAKIKDIRELLIGVKAGEEFKKGMDSNRITRLLGGPTVGVVSTTAGPDGDAIPATTAAPAATTPDGTTAAPAADAGRYVDAEGKPLAPGTNVADSEFKRIPVYLRLFMDQREISHLLIECANSPLPVEVRQLRINPKGASQPTAANQPKPGEQDQNPFDLVVELHGIIYVFNPPNLTKLGLTAAAATEGADAAAPDAPAAPADAAPADAAADAPSEPAVDKATDDATDDAADKATDKAADEAAAKPE